VNLVVCFIFILDVFVVKCNKPTGVNFAVPYLALKQRGHQARMEGTNGEMNEAMKVYGWGVPPQPTSESWGASDTHFWHIFGHKTLLVDRKN